MSGILKLVDKNFIPSCVIVILSQLLTLGFSVPLAWFSFILIGYLAWKIEPKKYNNMAASFVIMPLAYVCLANSPLVLSFFVAVLLELLTIRILRNTNSWSFAIELITIAMLLIYLAIELFLPDLPEQFAEYLATNMVLSSGMLLLSVAIEVTLLVWFSSRLQRKILPEKLLESAKEVRVSYTLLGLTILLPIACYFLLPESRLPLYILGFPYFIAGLSILSWFYQQYKKINTSANPIWLIFIVLYATLLPITLGFLGLIDVGINLREKYQNYLKRR